MWSPDRQQLTWKPIASALDQLSAPQLDVVRGGHGWLTVIVSDDRLTFTVEFDGPVAYAGVEEMAHALLSPESAELGANLRVANVSAAADDIAARLQEFSGRRAELRHYLLVGVSECIEVICEAEPVIAAHADEAAALAWARRDRRSTADYLPHDLATQIKLVLETSKA
jgi:hypothetical protein